MTIPNHLSDLDSKSKKQFNKSVSAIEKVLHHHYQGMFIHIWHIDLIEKEGGKNFGDAVQLYVMLHRILLMKENLFTDMSLKKLSGMLRISVRRTRQAKVTLLKTKLIKEARAKDKIGRNMKVITWLPFHFSEKKLRKLFKQAGYIIGKSRKSHHAKSDRVDPPIKPKSHPIKTEKSHPISFGGVYKGIIDKSIIKDSGILKNKRRGVGVKRNSSPGYKKPLSITDPKNPINKNYRLLAIKIMKVIIRDSKYTTIKPNEKDWTNAIRIFCERDSKDIKTGLKVIRAIIKYHDQPEKYYLTTIYQPQDLKGPDKLTKIGEFMKRVDEGPRQNNNNNSRIIVDSGIDMDNITYVKA